jgi:hypothetical protein
MLGSKDVTLGKAVETLYDARKLCDCGQVHTDSCRERFENRKTRQSFQTGVRKIKDRLRTSEPGRKLVDRYDALHPDRKGALSKKSMER